jgi:hypothetical protein
MDLKAFLQHVQENLAPDPGWTGPLQALWYAEKGDWHRAHQICQKGTTETDAWIHACLHREEGDLSNARYWYDRARKREQTGTAQTERRELIAALIA